ncbi:MAG: prepilin-type N-terminal cleavage/methylation domain-containing protein [Acetobacteraceae bacterium]|nr:prepilin-type N-terminal cleavage/methylation domain-containing protein [Acetobacteraceae bacterium]
MLIRGRRGARRGRAPWARGQQGFTYLEMLVAVALLAITFVPLLGLLTAGLYANYHARYMTVAVELAQARIDQLRAQGFDAITDVPRGPADPGPPFEGLSGYEWEVEVEPLGDDLKDVTVTVFWSRPKSVSHVQLRTLVCRP